MIQTTKDLEELEKLSKKVLRYYCAETYSCQTFLQLWIPFLQSFLSYWKVSIVQSNASPNVSIDLDAVKPSSYGLVCVLVIDINIYIFTESKTEEKKKT